MDAVLYKGTFDYLKNGILPPKFSSNKANFIATAKKYQIDKNGYLITRNSKKCVLDTERESLFHAFHCNTFDFSKKIYF